MNQRIPTVYVHYAEYGIMFFSPRSRSFTWLSDRGPSELEQRARTSLLPLSGGAVGLRGPSSLALAPVVPQTLRNLAAVTLNLRHPSTPADRVLCLLAWTSKSLISIRGA
jgi:hypothetical protein